MKRKLKNALYATLIMLGFGGFVKLMNWAVANYVTWVMYILIGILLGIIWIMIYGMVDATNED